MCGYADERMSGCADDLGFHRFEDHFSKNAVFFKGIFQGSPSDKRATPFHQLADAGMRG
jgi:hypothetical protein